MGTLIPVSCLIVASPQKTGHRRQAEAIAQHLGGRVDIIEAAERSDVIEEAAASARVVIGAGRQSIGPLRIAR
ncbi:MAG: hypothetical protein AAGF45_01635, partial [Pseudomonadota bacterium]